MGLEQPRRHRLHESRAWSEAGSVVKFVKDDPQFVSENTVFLRLLLGARYRKQTSAAAEGERERKERVSAKRKSGQHRDAISVAEPRGRMSRSPSAQCRKEK